MKEIGKGGLQDKITASVLKQGGLALKTHGTLVKGMPDLVIVFPNVPTILAEVKHVGLKKPDAALFKPPLSPMQIVTINKLKAIDASSVCILTGVEVGKEIRLYVTLAPDQHIDLLGVSPHTVYSRGGFDILWLILSRFRHTWKAE